MDRMKELVSILNEAALSYYRDSKEIMSNFEYDKLYDELKSLEEDMGITLSNSPTVRVGSETLSSLPKEAHKVPMLSLNKTKSKEELLAFLSDHEGILSVKLDGLTVALTYDKGVLLKAVTRGNGEIGEVITENAKAFMNLPLKIPFKGELLLRGEAVISYSDFEMINEKIGDIDAKYKNPRNLASGSVRQLNPQITRDRRVGFYGFSLATLEGMDFSKRSSQLEFLKDQGFSLADFKVVKKENLMDTLSYFHHHVTESDLPSDGLVLGFEDLEYGRSLGATSKFPRDAMAFKWEDEVATTHLKEIIWNASRTGLINPIASFDPVELEGTTVKRASVHNVSILKELGLSKGDEITVYKANMIIPQVLDNLTRGGEVQIPENCPSCSQIAVLKKDKDVEVLLCINPHCPAKEIKSYELLTSRGGLNIEGLSEATLLKLIGEGLIHEPKDIFTMSDDLVKKSKFLDMEGFGEKSWNNLMENIEKSRHTSSSRVLYGLGILGIGSANAKVIVNTFGSDFKKLMDLSMKELKTAEGIGDILAENYVEFFKDGENRKKVLSLLEELIIEEKEIEGKKVLENVTLVITGNLSFGSRDEFKEYVESLGGKVASSISKNTNYLVNNDSASASSKNVKAKELGVKIVTEEDFFNIVNEMTKE